MSRRLGRVAARASSAVSTAVSTDTPIISPPDGQVGDIRDGQEVSPIVDVIGTVGRDVVVEVALLVPPRENGN